MEVATARRTGEMGHDDFPAHGAVTANKLGIIIIAYTKLISRKSVSEANRSEALEFVLLQHDMNEKCRGSGIEPGA